MYTNTGSLYFVIDKDRLVLSESSSMCSRNKDRVIHIVSLPSFKQFLQIEGFKLRKMEEMCIFKLRASLLHYMTALFIQK